MAFASIRTALRGRRLAWLLALALWLPVAQWAAATHALLHLHGSVVASGGAADDPAGHLPGSCELCVVAAALGAGAPASASPLPFPALAPAAPPAWRDAPAPGQRPALAYLSRAPPLSR